MSTAESLSFSPQGSDFGSNVVTANVTPMNVTPATHTPGDSMRSSLDTPPLGTPLPGTPSGDARPVSFDFGQGPPRGPRGSLEMGSDLGSELGSRPGSLDYGRRAPPPSLAGHQVSPV